MSKIPATCQNCGRGNLHVDPKDKHLFGFLCYESAGVIVFLVLSAMIILVLALIT